MKLIYIINRFCKTPSIEKRLLIQGLFFSFLFMIITSLPLKFYFKLLHSNNSTQNDLNEIEDIVIRITKTISRIKKIVPWEVNCLNNVITSKYLLKYYGVGTNIILSVLKDGNQIIEAHASLLIERKIYYLFNKNQHNFLIIE